MWLPLDVDADGARSGWIAVQARDRHLQIVLPWEVDDWVNCVWPTAFLRERLGPWALLGEGALAATGACRRNVRMTDGEWYAAVPRFFSTIGDYWPFDSTCEESALVMLRGERRWATTVRELDLAASLVLAPPSLVVGPRGPVFYDVSFGQKPGAYRARVAAAATPLLDLPPELPVRVVDWPG